MHKYTVDLLNTLDEYRLSNITYNHKDPLIKEQVGTKLLRPVNIIVLVIFLFVITMSNFILLSVFYNLSIKNIMIFNVFQSIIVLSMFFIFYWLGECFKFRIIFEKVRLNGSDYIEQIKDYFFYTPEIYNHILLDLEPCFKKMKDYSSLKVNIQKHKMTTQELFEIYSVVHHEYSKRQKYLNKIVKKSDFLENLKRFRKKELENINQSEEDAKDIKKFFSEQSYSGKSN